MFDVTHLKEYGSAIHLMRFGVFDPEHLYFHLTELEQQRVRQFKSLSRRREYTATRYLFHQLFEGALLKYTPNGAPYIDNEGFISVSHSKDVTGIVHNVDFPIALDIELIQSKACRLWPKFLSKEEAIDFDCSDPLEMSGAWSMKETLYKLSGQRGIIFKEQLILKRLEEHVFEGLIYLPNQAYRVKLANFVWEDCVVSLNLEACERIN
jgi:4'-phosphopantetheinyl transferase